VLHLLGIFETTGTCTGFPFIGVGVSSPSGAFRETTKPQLPTSQVRLSIITYEVTEQLKKVSKGEAKILVIIELDQNQALLVAEETKTPSSVKQS